MYWTLHDFNTFTGGCHLAFNSDKFESNCSDCFQVENSLINIDPEKQLKFKIDLFDKYKPNISVITPSKWLGELSRKSQLLKSYPHYVVNNGLETDKFKSHNKEEIRDEYKIPIDKKVVLFVADTIEKEYKGFQILLDALDLLDNDSIFLVSIGSGNLNVDYNNYMHLGYISGDENISKVYSLADVFVTPSLMDNFPNTIIEANLVGTPVIAFDTCGMSEMIETGKNGILSNELNVSGLKRGLLNFLSNKYSFDNDKIREESLKHYSIERMAKEYLQTYGMN